MRCPGCGADYVEGDRFCGNCGERLDAGNPPAASAAPAMAAPSFRGSAIAAPPVAPEARQAAPGEAGCPVCGAHLAPTAARCEVCGWEPGASVVIPGASASAPPAPLAGDVTIQPDSSARICPVHGPLDPSWTRCPYCLREGREGRLHSGPISATGGASAVAPAPAPGRPQPAEARVEPRESVIPPAPSPAAPRLIPVDPLPVAPPPMAAAPPPMPAAPAEPSQARPAPAQLDESPAQPRSSVGATFVVRRRPRVLAYLIERDGEETGRVHQLDDDVTDIGRDPRNHIVLSDVLISGFHARIERGPDGAFLAQDRQSTNGSFLNDEPLTDARPLQENDALRLGNTTLVLKVVS